MARYSQGGPWVTPGLLRAARPMPALRLAGNAWAPPPPGGSETLNHRREESSMQTHKLTVTAFSLGAALALGTPAKAADLPQSGTIKIHGTHKGTVQTVQVGEKHAIGAIEPSRVASPSAVLLPRSRHSGWDRFKQTSASSGIAAPAARPVPAKMVAKGSRDAGP